MYTPPLLCGGASVDVCRILKKNKQSSRPLNWLTSNYLNECFYLFIVYKVTESNSCTDYWKKHQDDLSVFLH